MSKLRLLTGVSIIEGGLARRRTARLPTTVFMSSGAVPAAKSGASAMSRGMHKLRPELRLLATACATGPKAPRRRDAEEQTSGRLDWVRLIELAEHHGAIAPLLAHLSDDKNTPVDVIRELQLRHQAGTMR